MHSIEKSAKMLTPVPVADLEEDTALELNRHLCMVLRKKATGDSSCYDKLVSELRQLFAASKEHGSSGNESRRLTSLLQCLAACASKITVPSHFSLCQVILNVQYTGHPTVSLPKVSTACAILLMHQEVQAALTELMIHWMLKNCALIPGCLSALTISLCSFMPTVQCTNTNTICTSSGQEPRIHKLILDAIEQVNALQPAIEDNFLKCLQSRQPYVKRPCEAHCLYLTNLFAVMKRSIGQHHQEKLWAMTVHHLLDIDIHIHVADLERSADLEKGVQNDAVFFCDLDSEQNNDQSSIAREFRTTMTVMDTLMELTFAELETVVSEGRLEETWRRFLNLLDTLMIVTQDVQFAHYLVFYLTLKNPDQLIARLTSWCLKRVEDANLTSQLRGTYALYVASFLARAKLAPLAAKLKCLDCLFTLCEDYAAKHARGQSRYTSGTTWKSTDGARRIMQHEMFYSAVQSIIYLLCYLLPPYFREDPDGVGQQLKVLVQERLSALLYHWLDPLNCVASVVAMQFTEIAETLKIINIRHLLKLDQLYLDARKLKAYFPFDPYCLHRSQPFLELEVTYTNWQDVADTLPGSNIDRDDIQHGEENALMECFNEDENSSYGSLLFCSSTGSSNMF